MSRSILEESQKRNSFKSIQSASINVKARQVWSSVVKIPFTYCINDWFISQFSHESCHSNVPLIFHSFSILSASTHSRFLFNTKQKGDEGEEEREVDGKKQQKLLLSNCKNCRGIRGIDSGEWTRPISDIKANWWCISHCSLMGKWPFVLDFNGKEIRSPAEKATEAE